MKPPCKKCLKYAVCISQNQLSCDELQNFFNDIHQSIKKRYVYGEVTVYNLGLPERNKAWDEAWEEMYKFLPNLKGMFRSTQRQNLPSEVRTP